MAQARTRNPRYVTETGTAIYPYLIEPDTKFNADGEYKVKLKLAPDSVIKDAKGKSLGDVQSFIDAMAEKSLEKAKQENKGKIKEADVPYEIDEDTGEVLVNFKLKAVGKTREGKEFTQAPALFDAKGKPAEPEAIWGGSLLKVSFEVVPFYTKLIGAGVSLRLKAVQIIELRKGGGASAENYGFGAEEGYEEEDAAGEAGFASDDEPPFETDDEEQERGDF
jgi:hypothetical protein